VNSSFFVWGESSIECENERPRWNRSTHLLPILRQILAKGFPFGRARVLNSPSISSKWYEMAVASGVAVARTAGLSPSVEEVWRNLGFQVEVRHEKSHVCSKNPQNASTCKRADKWLAIIVCNYAQWLERHRHEPKVVVFFLKFACLLVLSLFTREGAPGAMFLCHIIFLFSHSNSELFSGVFFTTHCFPQSVSF
jgi:hypothetical protein